MVDPDSLVSPEYRAQLREMHEQGKWPGLSCVRHINSIEKLVRLLGAKSILDYGSGPGLLKEKLVNVIRIPVTDYDPGIPGKDGEPEPADMVVCTDVMEHVEPEHLDNVIQHIFELCRKGAFITVATRGANKNLPDGRNAHLIIEGWKWWRRRFGRYDWKIAVRFTDDNLLVFWLRKRS